MTNARADESKSLQLKHSKSIEDPLLWMYAPQIRDSQDILYIEKLTRDLAYTANENLIIGRSSQAINQLKPWISWSSGEYDPDEFNVEYLSVDGVVEAMLLGWPQTEIEMFSPYARDYRDSISLADLSKTDASGLELWKMFKTLDEVLPGSTFISMVDDFTEVGAKEGIAFAANIGELLIEAGIIDRDETPGDNYTLILESEMSERADEFIERLRSADGEVIEENGEIRFYPSRELIYSLAIHSTSRKKEFKKSGVLLSRDGVPSCPLMDCSSYKSEMNKLVSHWVILPNWMKQQQDRTYALLRALNIVDQEKYQNAFFPEDAEPVDVVAFFASLLSDAFQRRIDSIKERRSSTLLETKEKLEIKETIQNSIQTVIKAFDGRILTEAVEVAIVQPQDDLQGLSMWNKMLPPQSKIVLKEYNHENREQLIQELASQSIEQNTEVNYSSLLDIEEESYCGISSFFVGEFFTSSRVFYQEIINTSVRGVKVGGALVSTHMIGDTLPGMYPTPIATTLDLREIYRNLQVDFEIFSTNASKMDVLKENYVGPVIVIGTRT